MQPNPNDYGFDLEQALASVVGVRANVPEDAVTAEILGTEREGSGVFIRKDGLIATIGYLVMEADTVWIGLHDGRAVPGHVLGFDPETGFGLVQALARGDFPFLDIGRSADLALGDKVVLAGSSDLGGAVAAHVVARQEFAGYWEYLIGDAIFTAPAHSHWGGTALIDRSGKLVGIGSLAVQHASRGQTIDLNMVVPIDLLTPILDDLATIGRARRPARPWLGLYAREMKERVAVLGVASRGPAAKAGIVPGDAVHAVGDRRVQTLADFYRAVWGLGVAGIEVPLTLMRDGESVFVRVKSVDRTQQMKGPVVH